MKLISQSCRITRLSINSKLGTTPFASGCRIYQMYMLQMRKFMKPRYTPALLTTSSNDAMR